MRHKSHQYRRREFDDMNTTPMRLNANPSMTKTTMANTYTQPIRHAVSLR